MRAEERETFDAFVRGRGADLLRFARALSGDRATAEDLLQEALVRTGERWGTVAATGDPAGYVRRVMVNTRVSWWRRLRRERLTAVVPDVAYVAEPRDEAVLAALGDLPARQRAVVALRYLADYSEADTAAALGCSLGTVKSQAAKALAKLRVALAAGEPAGQEGWR